MRTNSDATLYNKSIVAGAEAWTRTVIVGPNGEYGVQWENRKAANVMRSGILEADSVNIYIPFNRGSLVFKLGDIMVKGTVTDVVDSTIFTPTMLKAKYVDVVTIKSVDTKDFGSAIMQHWQIGAS